MKIIFDGIEFDPGHESTVEQCRARAGWDRAQAISVIGTCIGWEHLAEGHKRSAQAYEDRALDLGRA